MQSVSSSTYCRVADNSGVQREVSKVLPGERSPVPLFVWAHVAASEGEFHTSNARGPGHRSRAGEVLIETTFPEAPLLLSITDSVV
jgi:hypothetical protein